MDRPREDRWKVGAYAIPLEQQLGGAQPTEESWPGYSFAADLQQTLSLQQDISPAGLASGSSSIPAPPTNVQETISASSYHRISTLPVTFSAALSDVPALASPGTAVIRGFLSVRNPSASTGNVLIAFDLPASDINSIISLAPGQAVVLDTFVPQGDLHLSATVIPTNAVVGYSNFPNPNP
jgi:hypothetical protein